MNSNRKTLLSFLGGAAAGALIAWLFSSEKGKDIRKKVGESIENMSKNLSSSSTNSENQSRNNNNQV
jgi:hypothetical protein